jgi:sugar lactone lactonase YvrE
MLLRITLLLCATIGLAFSDPPNSRPLGDSKVFAAFPFPGYPEGIAIRDGRVYASGPANFGVPGNGVPSTIVVYDLKTGAIVDTITIQNQPGPMKAISCITFGDGDDLYVADIPSASILKINVKTKQQSTYAGPFTPVYQSAFNPPAPFLMNDLVFDKKGYLYVSDSFQATIWRIAPGGGVPQVWFQSAALDGPFGPNGLRVDKKSERLYVAKTFASTGEGVIYTLPLVNHPAQADLKVFHTYTPGAGPDGLSFGKSGNLYVALAGYSQISVLNENGVETARYSGPAGSLPWANPANMAFDDGNLRILVTNHASLTGMPDPSPLFAVFDVYVGEKGGKLFGTKNNGSGDDDN